MSLLRSTFLTLSLVAASCAPSMVPKSNAALQPAPHQPEVTNENGFSKLLQRHQWGKDKQLDLYMMSMLIQQYVIVFQHRIISCLDRGLEECPEAEIEELVVAFDNLMSRNAVPNDVQQVVRETAQKLIDALYAEEH